MKRFAAAIGRYWDIDPGQRDAMAFEREVAIVNLRRMRLILVLMLFADTISLVSGLMAPPLIVRVIVSLAMLAILPWVERAWTLRLQQQLIRAALVAELAVILWATASYSGRLGTPSGYPINLVFVGLLLLIPPTALAPINVALFAVYCLIIATLPLPHATRLLALASTAIVAVIVQVASSLIYTARRSDHAQRQLIRAQNAQLARQNRELDELMAITAHDLRSPLHGLRNLFDLALRRAEEGQEDVLRRAVRDGTHSLDAMLALITRLLDAHEAEHAPLAGRARDDLRSHILAAARRVAPQADSAAVRLDLDLPDQPARARVDGGAIGQILDNLLANAIRHSPAGAMVRLACVSADGVAVVTIEDRGPGIDPARRAGLFTKFNRGGPRDPARGSAGMGLYIAATLAERLGARLAFRPAEPHGAVFELSVPLDPEAALPHQP